MTYIGFISGIYMATFAACGVFFLKFWKASHDNFFLYFTGACWLIALERVALLIVLDAKADANSVPDEAQTWVYFIRLVAFALILMAIISKNRKSNRI